jgi:hypothetical protein
MAFELVRVGDKMMMSAYRGSACGSCCHKHVATAEADYFKIAEREPEMTGMNATKTQTKSSARGFLLTLHSLDRPLDEPFKVILSHRSLKGGMMQSAMEAQRREQRSLLPVTYQSNNVGGK